MYHPINWLNCPALQKLNTVARLTVAFGLQQTLNLPIADLRTRFVDYCTANGFPNAGEWLWGKPVVIRQRIITLVKIPLDQKQDVLAALDHDLDLDISFQDSAFRLPQLPAINAPALQIVNDIWHDFYTDILLAEDGVPGDKLNEASALTRQTVLRAYLDAQRQIRLKTCPGCDGDSPSVADGNIHEDLDHIFPKSRYGFLAIQPLNLTPLCKDCNQTYKKSKDAITDNDPLVSDVHTLRDIYHPYLRPARDDIDLVVQRDANNEPCFCLHPHDVTAVQTARLHSLQYLLNLEARWTGDLHEDRIQEYLESALLQDTEDERNGQVLIDAAWLTERLQIALISFKRGQGKIPGHVAAHAYTAWVTVDQQAHEEWRARVQKVFATKSVERV